MMAGIKAIEDKDEILKVVLRIIIFLHVLLHLMNEEAYR